MRKAEAIDVRVPARMLMDLREVAKGAGLATETVLKVALATEVRRWNRESDIRWERDMLVVFVKEVASGVYKPRELRKRAEAVISEMSHAPPNTGGKRRRPRPVLSESRGPASALTSAKCPRS